MNYLIYSNSYRLMNNEAKKIIKDNENITNYDMAFDELDNIIEEAAYYSLFDENKIILVKNALCFNKAKERFNEDLLLNYLRNPNPKTILIFTTSINIDNNKEITKEIKKQKNYIEIKQLSNSEIETEVKKIITKNNFTINKEDITYIINASLKNYDLTMNNIEKIMLYYDAPCFIEHKDVVNLTSNSIEDNSFKFIDSVTDKNINEAFKNLKDLVLYRVDLITLNGMLINEYKNILKSIAYKQSGYSNKEIEKALKKRDWQVNKYLTKGNKLNKNEREMYLRELLELDYNMKNGKIDPQTGIELFLLSL